MNSQALKVKVCVTLFEGSMVLISEAFDHLREWKKNVRALWYVKKKAPKPTQSSRRRHSPSFFGGRASANSPTNT